MQSEELIAKFKRHGEEELQVSLRWYRGRLIVDLRNFYLGSEGEMLPTKSGISFAIGKLRSIITALEAASDRAEEMARENSA